MESTLSDTTDSEVDERPSFESNSFDANERPSFGSNSFDDSRKRSRDSDSGENDDFGHKRRRTDGFPSNFHQNTDESEDEPQTVAKKNVIMGMMEKMGYIKGKGLGKNKQGRVEPVQAFNQKGYRGLGHENKQLIEATLKWDPKAEVVSVQEELQWIKNEQQPPTGEDIKDWIKLGPSKETIDDETLFCSENIVERVVNSKSIFDSLDKHEMRRARTRSNPYETIRGAFFLNRAAVKMANMDKACGFMFTRPHGLRRGELLYFADVCAGPGGFSEYVLWRKKWHAKGFGFTLKESNDFKLDDFYAGSPETFHPFYGPKDDGNVYDPENQAAFRQLIMQHTRGVGVHFMMSDGGFSVEGKENIQEILSKQLYLCQCLVALMIVREGGHFVTKVFDLFTPFSAGLVYLMYRCFRRVTIFKPNTSRPANSERYLICEGKLPNTDDIINYLSYANKLLLKNDKQRDVMELVPLEILQDDENFFNYLVNSNDSLGSKQIVGLLKIAAYCEDPTLFETRQAQMKKECLEYWDLPDQSRIRPKDVKPEDKLQGIVRASTIKVLKNRPTVLTQENVNVILGAPCDWQFVLCGSAPSNNINDNKLATFYLGLGRTKVFKLVKDSWVRVINIELPPDTFIYAELVEELRGQHKMIRKTSALHIIDAYMLGGEHISQEPLSQRYALINKFCEALWKPDYKEQFPVRAKELHSVDRDFESKLNLKTCTLKNGTEAYVYHPDESMYPRRGSRDDPFFFVPNTIMFLKSTCAPWSKHMSKSTGHHYYFNSKTDEKFFEKEKPTYPSACFTENFVTRVEWHWRKEDSLCLDYLYREIREKCLNFIQPH